MYVLSRCRGLSSMSKYAKRALLSQHCRHNCQQQQSSSMSSSGSPVKACNGCCHQLNNKHRDGFAGLLAANREWAAQMREADPDFFNRLVNQQNPEYLWIGCSDSRVPANQILGLAPGEIFVQRNVGNQAMHTDMNLMACLEYAVKSLKVKTIILCGHYNCGAVKAALQLPHTTPGLVNCWISDIRECRNQAEAELRGLDSEQQLARLCELNVLRQVFHVATSPVVAGAWAEGQELHLYGVIYDLADGHLRKLAGPICGDDTYNHSLEDFVLDGMCITRCPDTQQLRVSSNEEDHVHLASGNGAAAPALAVRKASGSSGSEEADVLFPLSMLASPSDLVSSINNINLAESLAKHKRWSSQNERSIGGAAASPAEKQQQQQQQQPVEHLAVMAAGASC